MTLPAQRLIILIGAVSIFGALTSFYIYRTYEFKQNNFRVGSVPQEIINQLTPQDIPLSSMHPPALRSWDPMRYGDIKSLVSVIEYGDYNCESCRKMAPEIEKAVKPYGGKVRFVWRDLPIDESPKNSTKIAIFARCAGQQGKFWGAFDSLMASSLTESELDRIAKQLKLDLVSLNACRKNKELEALIKLETEEARADGINSAPFLFIGTKAIKGFLDASALKQEIDEALSAI